jgi:HSP20 family protein
MTTRTFGPLLEVARIQSEINRLFDNLLDLRTDDKGVGSWIPNVDILENEDSLVVKIELPGIGVADLSLTVHSGNIVIAGRKPGADVTGEADFQVCERAYGPFRRVIHLGVPVNTRQAQAVLKNGLLRICFPKVPNRRGEAVPIEVETK